MGVLLSFKPGALEKIMRNNAHRREGWETLERIGKSYDNEEARILDVGIHGDVWPGGHKYIFKRASYETCDIDAGVMPTHTADIRKLDFEDETFDMIICHSVIEHVLERRTEAYKELFRVLKKGGTLVYVWPITMEKEVEASSYVPLQEIKDAYKGVKYTLRRQKDNTYFMEIKK